MANSADPDELASDLDLYCLQSQGISGLSRTRVKKLRDERDNMVLPHQFSHLSFNSRGKMPNRVSITFGDLCILHGRCYYN